jgi:hypothetical protein
MEQLLLESGTTGHLLLQLSYSPFGNIATDCWIKTVWKFDWKIEIDITTGVVLME